MNLRLFCGITLVGEVADVTEHQGTWFGMFQPAIPFGSGPAERRIREFIVFCEDWNRRCAEGL